MDVSDWYSLDNTSVHWEAGQVSFPTSTLRQKESRIKVLEGYWAARHGKQALRWKTLCSDFQCLETSRCSVKVSFFSSFSCTDFHPSDSKCWRGINNAVWVDKKATMYYLRLPKRNHKFSLHCRHLLERQAAAWELAQSRNNVLGIFLNPALFKDG